MKKKIIILNIVLVQLILFNYDVLFAEEPIQDLNIIEYKDISDTEVVRIKKYEYPDINGDKDKLLFCNKNDEIVKELPLKTDISHKKVLKDTETVTVTVEIVKTYQIFKEHNYIGLVLHKVVYENKNERMYNYTSRFILLDYQGRILWQKDYSDSKRCIGGIKAYPEIGLTKDGKQVWVITYKNGKKREEPVMYQYKINGEEIIHIEGVGNYKKPVYECDIEITVIDSSTLSPIKNAIVMVKVGGFGKARRVAGGTGKTDSNGICRFTELKYREITLEELESSWLNMKALHGVVYILAEGYKPQSYILHRNDIDFNKHFWISADTVIWALGNPMYCKNKEEIKLDILTMSNDIEIKAKLEQIKKVEEITVHYNPLGIWHSSTKLTSIYYMPKKVKKDFYDIYYNANEKAYKESKEKVVKIEALKNIRYLENKKESFMRYNPPNPYYKKLEIEIKQQEEPVSGETDPVYDHPLIKELFENFGWHKGVYKDEGEQLRVIRAIEGYGNSASPLWTGDVPLSYLASYRGAKVIRPLVEVILSPEGHEKDLAVKDLANHVIHYDKKAKAYSSDTRLIPFFKYLVENSDNTSVKNQAIQGLYFSGDKKLAFEAMVNLNKKGIPYRIMTLKKDKELIPYLKMIIDDKNTDDYIKIKAAGSLLNYYEDKLAYQILDRIKDNINNNKYDEVTKNRILNGIKAFDRIKKYRK